MNSQKTSRTPRGRYAAIVCGLTLALVGGLGSQAAAQTLDPSRASELRSKCQQGDQAACADYTNLQRQCADACAQARTSPQGNIPKSEGGGYFQLNQQVQALGLCLPCQSNGLAR